MQRVKIPALYTAVRIGATIVQRISAPFAVQPLSSAKVLPPHFGSLLRSAVIYICNRGDVLPVAVRIGAVNSTENFCALCRIAAIFCKGLAPIILVLF